MNPEDIRAFVGRDWSAVAESKAAFWAERKQTMSAGEALAVAEALRLHVRALRPEWPDGRSREEDLAGHARVAEALRAVAIIPSR